MSRGLFCFVTVHSTLQLEVGDKIPNIPIYDGNGTNRVSLSDILPTNAISVINFGSCS